MTISVNFPLYIKYLLLSKIRAKTKRVIVDNREETISVYKYRCPMNVKILIICKLVGLG